MSWAIGITMYPDRSYIEISGRLINSTPDDNSMLYWSNIATAVNDDYQIIFPQSTEFGVYHAKNSFCHWPVTHETFNGIDSYKNNLDASWWKSHAKSNSIFAWDLKEDYIAGYDHGKHAGTMVTGNHHIVKGAKFWLWGPNSGWDTKILTDNDGSYCELMVGAYSDNQPDYSWISPYEVKQFTHYCYGIRDIEGVKAGNRDYALNLDFTGKGKALVGVNSTLAAKDMKLRLTNKGETIYDAAVNVAPDAPFTATVKLPKEYNETDMTLTLSDNAGNRILSYTPVVKDSNKPLPEIVDRPKRPADIDNIEECYLVGLRNLQFHNPFIDPTDYFKEVLRRDPGETRANTKMGVWYRQRGDYAKAKEHLRRAIKRLTHDYTRPSDCEAIYNLGLILKEEGNYDAALDTLYRAVWNYTYNSPANFQLAQIYNTVGDTDMAIERADEAITYNSTNYNAKNIKASILREKGLTGEAIAIANDVLASDPLNMYAARELQLCGAQSDFATLMRDEPESYIELALNYLHNGYPEQAQELLQYIDGKKQYPTVKMWLGYLAHQQGDTATAARMYADALALPVDFCNPFRLETVPVLELAKQYQPGSYKPHYYLGNLWYDKNQEKAVAEWTTVTEKEPSFAMAWRNLGWAYWVGDKPDYGKSAAYYRKAFELDPDDALILEELDQVYEAQCADVNMRHNLLKSHHSTAVKRYAPLNNEVITSIFVGDYDYALDLLANCYFPTREGVANFHDVYVDALLMAGTDKIAKGDFDGGMALFKKSFEYPENHQVFFVDTRTPRDAQVYWYIANACEKHGKRSEARKYYRKAAEVDTESTDFRYWKGLSLAALGRNDEAKALFNELKEAGANGIVTDFVSFFGSEGNSGGTVEAINTKAYYTKALGEYGLGELEAAKADMASSVNLRPDNLWAVTMLKEMTGK